MLMRQLKFSFLTSCALSFLLTACVSVSLGPKAPGRADVKFNEPASKFTRVSNANADIAWQSQKTGNTISYLSECPQTESSLDSMASEFHSVLADAKTTSREEKFFNGREALWTQSEGKLDGIDMKVASVVFKRNGCSFLITFVARKGRFKDEYPDYQHFLEGFQAP